MRTTSNPNLIPQEQLSQIREMIIMRGCVSEDTPKPAKEKVPVVKTKTPKRTKMITKEFTFKVVRATKAQTIALINLIEEAYNLRGYLLKRLYNGEDPWEIKPWLLSFYSVQKGGRELFREIKFLDQNMIGYILDDIRRIYNLVKESHSSNKVYLGLNTSEHKSLLLGHYGFSHNFISSDLMRVMGISEPLKLIWTDPLESFDSVKCGPIKIKYTRSNFYITMSCMVSSEKLPPIRHHQTENTFQPHTSTISLL